MKPNYLDELIRRASKNAGSEKALAAELEVSPTVVSDWKSGRKPCSPENQALMASMAGLDAEAWGARAMIAKHEGTTKGAKLEAALKKALLATGAGLLSCGVEAAQAISAALNRSGDLYPVLHTMYKLSMRRRFNDNLAL